MERAERLGESRGALERTSLRRCSRSTAYRKLRGATSRFSSRLHPRRRTPALFFSAGLFMIRALYSVIIMQPVIKTPRGWSTALLLFPFSLLSLSLSPRGAKHPLAVSFSTINIALKSGPGFLRIILRYGQFMEIYRENVLKLWRVEMVNSRPRGCDRTKGR